MNLKTKPSLMMVMNTLPILQLHLHSVVGLGVVVVGSAVVVNSGRPLQCDGSRQYSPSFKSSQFTGKAIFGQSLANSESEHWELSDAFRWFLYRKITKRLPTHKESEKWDQGYGLILFLSKTRNSEIGKQWDFDHV